MTDVGELLWLIGLRKFRDDEQKRIAETRYWLIMRVKLRERTAIRTMLNNTDFIRGHNQNKDLDLYIKAIGLLEITDGN